MAKLHHSQPGLLLVRNKTQVMIPLTKEIITIGRKQADIILDDAKASGAHAEIRKEGSQWKLVDLKSTNGTFLNRRKASENILTDQDVIEIGLTTLLFFENTADFHGQVEEVTGSHRVEETSEKVDVAHVTEWTTTTQTAPQSGLSFLVLEGEDLGKKFSFKKSHIMIGRAKADLTLQDMDISRNHALIEVLSQTTIYIRDLESTNGTFVNGEKVTSAKISDGDLISLGNTKLELRVN